MIKVFKLITTADNTDNVIKAALDRKMKDTYGKINVKYKDEVIGYCYKYETVSSKSIDIYTEIMEKPEGDNIAIILNNPVENDKGELIRADVKNFDIF